MMDTTPLADLPLSLPHPDRVHAYRHDHEVRARQHVPAVRRLLDAQPEIVRVIGPPRERSRVVERCHIHIDQRQGAPA